MYPHERSLVNDMNGRPFALLGVNNDEKLSRVKKAVKKNNINWRSWYDGEGGDIVKKFKIRSFPTIFLVDHTGVIRYKNLRGDKLDRAIELLVTEAEEAGMSGAPVVVAKRRTFRDATGKHSVYATFKSFEDGMVELQKKDGSTVALPLEKLSKTDRRYLEKEGYVSKSDLNPAVESNRSVASKSDQADSVPESRLFVDSTGKFKVQATFLRRDGDKVVLRKDSGDEVTLPMKRLSERDQKYVEGIAN